jgi:hypothetical protein
VGKAVGPETLDAAAFMVDTDQQVFADVLDFQAQLAEFAPVFPVAAEQNDAAGERMFEAPAVGLGECGAGDVDDEGGVLGHKRNPEVARCYWGFFLLLN